MQFETLDTTHHRHKHFVVGLSWYIRHERKHVRLQLRPRRRGANRQRCRRRIQHKAVEHLRREGDLDPLDALPRPRACGSIQERHAEGVSPDSAAANSW